MSRRRIGRDGMLLVVLLSVPLLVFLGFRVAAAPADPPPVEEQPVQLTSTRTDAPSSSTSSPSSTTPSSTPRPTSTAPASTSRPTWTPTPEWTQAPPPSFDDDDDDDDDIDDGEPGDHDEND